VPTKVSDLTNDSGYITGITSSDVTTALGYTPYDSSNPSGYQANVIETVKVNGTALTPSGKAVDISVPTVTSTYSATGTDAVNGTAVASAISGKANKDLSNISDAGKLVIDAEIGNRTRKDIGTLVSNGTLAQAVAEQNLEKYGISIGDYFTGASGYEYTVADMDTFYGGYNSNAIVNTHHVCLVVNTKHNEPWNYSTTNNFTDGGYVASNLHSYLTGTALTNVQADITTLAGANHLLAHGKIYSNAVKSNRYNRTGQNDGASSDWAFSSSQYISALTEAQVYGTIVWSSSGNDTGEAFKQLEVFRKFRANQITGYTGVW
jgi:hypothetical protein